MSILFSCPILSITQIPHEQNRSKTQYGIPSEYSDVYTRQCCLKPRGITTNGEVMITKKVTPFYRKKSTEECAQGRMKPVVHYASKNMVFVEVLHREKYLVSMMLQPIYST
jgi:hypothetical protein